MADVILQGVEVCREGHVILHDLDFQANRGELVAILGPSGSGKTTFLHVLLGLLTPDCGTLQWLDQRIHSRNASTYRAQYVGMMFQHAHLCSYYSARENLQLGLSGSVYDEGWGKALEIGPLLDRSPKELSGGERARVSLLRAVRGNPSLLCCDEPTGALDARLGHKVMNQFVEYAKKHLVVITTHDEELAHQYATTIYRLVQGKLVMVLKQTNTPIPNPPSHSLRSYHYSWNESWRGAQRAWRATRTLYRGCVFTFAVALLGMGVVVGLQEGVPHAVFSAREAWLDNRDITLEYQQNGMTMPLPSSTQRHLAPLIQNAIEVPPLRSILNQLLPPLQQPWSDAEWVAVDHATLHQEESLLLQGTLPVAGRLEVVVNETYLQQQGTMTFPREISLEGTWLLPLTQGVLQEPQQLTVTLVGVIDDGTWSQTPKWYVEEETWLEWLHTTPLTCLSNEEETVTLYDYWWDLAYYGSHRPLQYRFATLAETEVAYASMLRLPLATNEPWVQTPTPHRLWIQTSDAMVRATFPNLWANLQQALWGFLWLLLIGMNGLNLLVFDYAFQQRRREGALLQAMGLPRSSLRRLLLGEWIRIGGSSLLLALVSYGLLVVVASLLPFPFRHGLTFSLEALGIMIGGAFLFFGIAAGIPGLRLIRTMAVTQLRDDV